ncbi:MAG TPA: propanediol utilization protein [Ruminococcaceae bacterium]|nr:phosphate propanoyltransferase [Oscillospiraceae bacterium]MDD5919896.1 phosphate propanoyltransferase [Oscillospiraceae bacterium]HAG56783.1 propanediol utilization protein [Oscillospiraceae bacterium]HAO69269.1 propanediol utilization protein [Oscillospiraceae bacterium]HCB65157.1 propanediol utilization protein [Oscillospiraceae bacterium]
MSNKVLVETSARHVHVTQQDLETLFGKGAALTPKKDLSQPGQFACTERVDVVGPKKTIPGVTILGPVRPATQIEVSLTDARTLGVSAPVRESGDIAGSAPCKLVGPCGEVELSEGVIAAKRHIHATPEDAQKLGVADKEIVKVKIDTNGRSLIFDDVVVRVSPKFALAMHIDTDESNAAGCAGEVYGEIVK